MSPPRRYSLEIRAHCPEESRAQALSGSLGPDNEGYVETDRDGEWLCFRMSAADAGTLKQTADDLLACLRVAEDVSFL